jgi:hypothetical protein
MVDVLASTAALRRSACRGERDAKLECVEKVAAPVMDPASVSTHPIPTSRTGRRT